MSQSSAASAFFYLAQRDLKLALRQRNQVAMPVVFFVIVVSLFPLAVSPERDLLSTIAPGIIWVSALLATLLSLDSLFRSDFEDGSLELILLSPHPTSILVAAKILAHWLITGLPLVLVSPLLAVFLGLPTQAIPVMLASLALGTPVLSLVGGIAIALTVGLRRGGALLSLLVLPLYVPVLIFGASAVLAAANGLSAWGQLYFLGALFVLALTLAPITSAAALRITVN